MLPVHDYFGGHSYDNKILQAPDYQTEGMDAGKTGTNNHRAAITQGTGASTFFVQHAQQYLLFFSRKITKNTWSHSETVVAS